MMQLVGTFAHIFHAGTSEWSSVDRRKGKACIKRGNVNQVRKKRTGVKDDSDSSG